VATGKYARRLKDLGEFALIDAIASRCPAGPSVIHGIGDDAAVVKASRTGYDLLTTDMLVENVHFTGTLPPRAIGHKALACSISDIAAMGGEPRHALVSLGVSPRQKADFVIDLYRGMGRLAKVFGVSIVGGDTVRSETTVVSVALGGHVKKKHLVTRAGARPGDVICVTGALGNSLKSGHHCRFIPRVRQSSWLVRHLKPSAMIDISDGLAADLRHILKAGGGLGAQLALSGLPLRRGARSESALFDGEDFELCLTLGPRRFRRWRGLKDKPFPLYPVGVITEASRGLVTIDARGRATPVARGGFTHFY
jgi:thiamine-monophosphate kinase